MAHQPLESMKLIARLSPLEQLLESTMVLARPTSSEQASELAQGQRRDERCIHHRVALVFSAPLVAAFDFIRLAITHVGLHLHRLHLLQLYGIHPSMLTVCH